MLERLPLNPERQQVIAWAAQMCAEGFVALDTETTDHPRNRPEMCEIAMVAHHPNQEEPEVLLDTLVRPTTPIAEGAQAIHGITLEVCQDAPTACDLFGPIMQASCAYKNLLIYNRQFDLAVLRTSARNNGINTLKFQESSSRPGQLVFWSGSGVHCAMERYGQYVQQRNPKFPGTYTWQKLPPLAEERGKGVAHRASADCYSTIYLVRWLASLAQASPLEEVAVEFQARSL